MVPMCVLPPLKLVSCHKNEWMNAITLSQAKVVNLGCGALRRPALFPGHEHFAKLGKNARQTLQFIVLCGHGTQKRTCAQYTRTRRTVVVGSHWLTHHPILRLNFHPGLWLILKMFYRMHCTETWPVAAALSPHTIDWIARRARSIRWQRLPPSPVR